MSRRNDEEKDSNAGAVLAATAAVALAGAVAYFLWPEPEPEPVRPVPNRAGPENAFARPQQANGESLREWVAQNRDKRTPDEGEDIPDALLCKICMLRRLTHSFSCGHTTCLECAVDLCDKFGKCPFDQSKLTAVPKRLFF
ncbi:hypothetical protein BASA81_005337 [Batrachochytrium salamandrivorans]|nr:hypothetical protein BASA81_005337 [Batrachochytrium salamandrivorans]